MNIEELRSKHDDIYYSAAESGLTGCYQHTKLSIQFAIEVLQEIAHDESTLDTVDVLYAIIEELKQYLDAK